MSNNYEDLISRFCLTMYGIDLSKLNWREEKEFLDSWVKRLQLEEELQRRNPKPERKLSEAEELQRRWLALQDAKIERIRNGRPQKDLSNKDLAEINKIMRSIVERLGGE